MKPNVKTNIYHLFRLILGGIFIWASLGKIGDPRGFAEVVKNYRMLPLWAIDPFSLMLPWIEILCGAALLTGYLIKGSALIADFLMIVFMLSIGINMVRGVNISCGCFSNSMEISRNMTLYLIRDAVCLFMGIWVLAYRMKGEKQPSILNAG
jgi:uncharacterized membrane protein YphA (DoxX/SURF4 family)